MARKPGPKENFRVVVEPRSLTDFGSVRTSRGLFYPQNTDGQSRWEADMEARCEEIISDIQRHADNVDRAYVEYDQSDVCEHCGWAWTEDGDDYNGCCEADEIAHDTALALAKGADQSGRAL